METSHDRQQPLATLRRLLRGRWPCFLLLAAFALLSICVLLLIANPNQSLTTNIQVLNLAGSLSSISDHAQAPSPTPTPLELENGAGSGLSDGKNAEFLVSGAPTPNVNAVDTSHTNSSILETAQANSSGKGATSQEMMHRPKETGAPGDCAILMLYNGGFPPFLIHTLSQIRCWNPASDCDLWLVGNESAIDKFMSEDLKKKKDEFQLKIGILEELKMTDDYWYFLENTPLIAQGPFWVRAATRCFFIEAAMRKYELADVTYFETDIMPYFSVRNFMPLFRSLVSRFAVTPTSNGQFTLGVTFIRKSEDMREFNHFQRKYYTTSRGGWEPSEMKQLSDFKKQMGDEYLYTFPTLPYLTDNDATNKMAFDTEHVFPPNIVFDSASWGQYYGGTPNGDSPGYNSHWHYVGAELKKGCCSMRWEREEETGRWFPVVDWTNPNNDTETGSSKIMDLHIHSKRAKFMMNSCRKDGKPIGFVPLPADD